MKKLGSTKKRLVYIALIVFCLFLLSSCGKEGISIDEENFPDKSFRDYLHTQYDKDNDNKLSNDELENLTYLAPSQPISSLEGIEYLKNLEKISLFDSEFDKLDLGNNPNIQKLYLTNCIIQSDVVLSNNSRLTEISVSGGAMGKVTISDDQELKSAVFSKASVDGLEINNCRNLELLSLNGIDSIQSINLDTCDNLQTISANYCEKLESVSLGIAPKLYDVQILDCSVNELDITGCELMLKLSESSHEENERYIKYTLAGDADTGLRPYNLCIDAGMTLVTE